MSTTSMRPLNDPVLRQLQDYIRKNQTIPAALSHRYLTKIEEVDRDVVRLRTANENLKAYRDALLERLVELGVSDATDREDQEGTAGSAGHPASGAADPGPGAGVAVSGAGNPGIGAQTGAAISFHPNPDDPERNLGGAPTDAPAGPPPPITVRSDDYQPPPPGMEPGLGAQAEPVAQPPRKPEPQPQTQQQKQHQQHQQQKSRR